MFRLAALFALAFAGWGTPAWEASKTTIVSLGDPAPGGGIFAGPSFTANPTAAGNGWVAFRAQVDDPTVREEIQVIHEATTPPSRAEVAYLGEAVPAGSSLRIKQFLGRPVVNSTGDVAFLATTTALQADGTEQTGAAIFLLHAGALGVIATSGTVTAGGSLDLAAPLDGDGGTVAERSPALNDQGDIAFVAPFQDTGGAAIFLASASGGGLVRVVGTGDPVAGGTLGRVGPPALNNPGTIVFHGTVGDPTQGADGIFAVSGGGPPSQLVGPALSLPCGSSNAQLTQFDDGVALNDHGTIVFTGGPLGTVTSNPGCPLGDTTVGAVVRTADGTATALACPGVPLKDLDGQLPSGAVLPPAAGSAVADPSITPDGTVLFFTSVDDGAAGAIMRATPDDYGSPQVVVHLGGSRADPTPSQGTYSVGVSPPAVDASGGIAFLAQVLGGSTSEGLFYQPAQGGATTIVISGQSTGSKSFFAGQAFGAPHLSDGGDVVFRAFTEQSASSVGIFRSHGGTIVPVARAGDPSPSAGAPFINFFGEPSVNSAGTVVFTANVKGKGHGVYLADASGLRGIAQPGDPVPNVPGATFDTLGLNPVINDDGVVAFRGTIRLSDPTTQREDALFLSDPGGIRELVGTLQSSPTPGESHFCKLGNPVLSRVPSIAFEATFGTDPVADSGVFLVEPGSVVAVALSGNPVGDGGLVSFSGTPTIDDAGDLAFLVKLAQGSTTNPAIVQSIGGALERLIAGGLAGPGGGSVKAVGAPSMNGIGHVAFRVSLVSGTGGTAGYFLAGDHSIQTLMAAGELAPGKGRITSFTSRATLNDRDQLAFIGNVSGGDSPTGIFLASQAVLVVQALRVQVVGRKKARIALKARLLPGSTTDGFTPTTDAVGVSLGDAGGALWSTTVAGGKLKRRGTRYVVSHNKALGALGLVVAKGAANVALRSTTVKLKRDVAGRVTPPLTVTLSVGGDAATLSVPCARRAGGRLCVWPH